MRKAYAVVVYQIETQDGMQWCAEFPDVKGCVGGGETAKEALEEAYENLEFHLEGLKQLGMDIPEPVYKSNESYSGKLMVRMSKSLHKDATECARNEGISLNSYIVEAIAEKNGKEKSLNRIETSVIQMTEVLRSGFEKVRSYSPNPYQYQHGNKYVLKGMEA